MVAQMEAHLYGCHIYEMLLKFFMAAVEVLEKKLLVGEVICLSKLNLIVVHTSSLRLFNP